MIYMMKQVETYKVSIFNVFPLRKDIIPKHIRLDTTTLVHLMFTKKQGNKTEYLTQGNLKRYEDKIWQFFFRTERNKLKNVRYTFNNMIETDGVSCSILMVRNDMVGKKFKPKMRLDGEKYIDELTDYTKLKDKKIVGIDPGKTH
jgi:histidinol phosphatase-like enzyme